MATKTPRPPGRPKAPVKSIRTGKRQYGVVPFRLDPDGQAEILLITSRETRRWVIPKGWPMVGRKPGEAAMVEALQEAGVTGHLVGRRIGSYGYLKVQQAGLSRQLQVRVFLMAVEQELAEWREQAERERRWLAPGEAAAMVAEPKLAKILRRIPRLVRAAAGS